MMVFSMLEVDFLSWFFSFDLVADLEDSLEYLKLYEQQVEEVPQFIDE